MQKKNQTCASTFVFNYEVTKVTKLQTKSVNSLLLKNKHCFKFANNYCVFAHF